MMSNWPTFRRFGGQDDACGEVNLLELPDKQIQIVSATSRTNPSARLTRTLRLPPQAHKTSTLCKYDLNWEGSTYMQYRLDDYARRHLACTVHKYSDDGESEASFPTATGGP